MERARAREKIIWYARRAESGDWFTFFKYANEEADIETALRKTKEFTGNSCEDIEEIWKMLTEE